MKHFCPSASRSAGDESAPPVGLSFLIEVGAAAALLLLLISPLFSFGTSGAASQARQPLRLESVLPAQQQAHSVELVGQIGGTTYAIAVSGTENPREARSQWEGNNQSFGTAAASWNDGGLDGRYITSLTVGTGQLDVVYAATESGLFKSADGAATWEKTGFPERAPGLFRLHATAPTPSTWAPTMVCSRAKTAEGHGPAKG